MMSLAELLGQPAYTSTREKVGRFFNDVLHVYYILFSEKVQDVDFAIVYHYEGTF